MQCGNGLKDCANTGDYDAQKLASMLVVVKKYGLISKEHNGDYNGIEIIKTKEQVGLEYINIAPELGTIESEVVLEHVKNNPEHFNKVYDLCIASGKWKKWVSPGFDVANNKEQIIRITGHYVYSHPEFIALKENYPDIDKK